MEIALPYLGSLLTGGRGYSQTDADNDHLQQSYDNRAHIWHKTVKKAAHVVES